MRGDFVTIVTQGDFGKPRPALIISADQFSAIGSLTVLPITSALIDAPLLRITVHPSAQNGLQKISQIMIDKALTLRKDKVGETFGQIESALLKEVERNLAVFFGIA